MISRNQRCSRAGLVPGNAPALRPNFLLWLGTCENTRAAGDKVHLLASRGFAWTQGEGTVWSTPVVATATPVVDLVGEVFAVGPETGTIHGGGLDIVGVLQNVHLENSRKSRAKQRSCGACEQCPIERACGHHIYHKESHI